MPKEKIFISGKISGYPYYYAYQKFAETDRYLSKLGYKVVNPMCLCQKNWSRLRCMAVCLWNLIHCDTIYMQEDWEDSHGARIEYTIACLLRKDINNISNILTMKTKIEIKSIFSEVLFAFEKENNTVKDTLQEAVKVGADLYGADLRGADLYGADLRGADLRGADLRGADLGDWGKTSSNTDVFIAGPLGSRNAYTTFYHTDKGVFVQCGCFRGTLAEFCDKVQETHGGDEHAQNYLALVEFVEVKWVLNGTERR